jgi:ATP-dependent helicase HrpB
MTRDPLPIDAVLHDVVGALHRHPALVITAPTGAGKTTRVPPAVLDGGIVGSKQIVMLEPRRLAARAAARRMAAETGCPLGDEVGYQVRFDRQCGRKTRILVVTDGLLIRMLQEDNFLEKVGVVIFDEFHERGLETDLALGMVRLVQRTVRPELRIIVMSATLAAEAVAAYLGDCPIMASEGRLHPVEIGYQTKSANESWPLAAARAGRELLDQTPGDLLVFLPGLREIRQTAAYLEGLASERDLLVLPLHGDLPAEEQDAALLPQQRRKIVLATNVAESSVTVEGITGVVDTGLARMLVLDPKTGLDRLQLGPISRASADQRAGRAGRTQPGMCLRLWSESAQRVRPAQTEPEIRRVDLAGPVLQLLTWGERAVEQFPWFEAPPEGHVAQALVLLRRLGAVDDRGVTELGQVLASLPVHPRLACLLAMGQRWGHLDMAALAAACLSERDPFSRAVQRPARQASLSDVLDRAHALADFERHGRCASALGTLQRGPARFVLHARNQFRRLLSKPPHPNPSPPSTGERGVRIANRSMRFTKDSERQPVSAEEAVLRALLAAFPDRLARRREPGSRKGVMVGGRGVRLAPASAVTEPELFLCVDVDAGQTEALVRQASAVERAWLPSEKLQTLTSVEFDASTVRVIARKRILYEDLLLQESPASLPDEEQVTRVLLEAALAHWDQVAPADGSPTGEFLTRVRCLRGWMPELNLPAFDDAGLRELLPELCPGCKSFADLHKAPWLDCLENRLTAKQRHALDHEAPERLLVPSGSRLALHYEEGRPPVLKARIQELFGWRETPRLAGGRVAVLLHLLAPSNRPQQITDDLASFWANTYPRVRKDLRARYPKHAWPEDPTTAPAQRGPGKKRSS